MSKKSKPPFWRWRYLPEHPNDPFGMRKRKFKQYFLSSLLIGASTLMLYDKLDSLGIGNQRLTTFVRETVTIDGIRKTRDVILATVVTLTSGTSYTKPADWNPASNTVECYGGGGAGGAGSNNCCFPSNGGGGGGGGYSITSNVSIPGATATYAIAAGGVGSTGSPTGGGTTSFTNASSATGGNPGANYTNGGGAGGGGTRSGGAGGTSVGYPQPGGGGGGCAGSSSGGGAGGTTGAAGAGGGGQAGSGGASPNLSPPPGGNPYGGGGAGCQGYNPGSMAGGNGYQGIIVITYTPALPSVTSCAPNSGSSVGGTSVTITGTNFLAVSSVTFGGTAATGITTVNSTTVTCTAPAHIPGLVNVIVTQASGSGTGTNVYTYLGAGGFNMPMMGF